MTQIQLVHRPALQGAASGHFGATGAGLRMIALPEDRLWHALARPGTDPAPLAAFGAGACPVRATAPGQWFVAGPGAGTLAEAQAALAPDFALSEQTHGRIRIALSGPRAAELLAKGTGADLRQLAPGEATQTLFGHIGVNIARLGAEEFELTVLRTFALSLWDELLLLGREYGIEAQAA